MPPKPSPSQAPVLKHKPKQTARRSKEERDAIERAEKERRQARADAAAVDEATEAARKRQHYGIQAPRRDNQKDGRYQGNPVTYRMGRGGRGGFMGATRPSTKQRPTENDSGRNEKSARAKRGGRESHVSSDVPRSAATTTSTQKSLTRALQTSTVIKNEVDTHQPGYPLLGVKKEDPEYIYLSDGEAGISGRNVDTIEIEDGTESSELESADDGAMEEHKRSTGIKRYRPSFVPRRIRREEHKDRILGINTESSAPIIMDGEKSEVEYVMSVKKKGKARVSIKPDPEAEAIESLDRYKEDFQAVDLSDDEIVDPNQKAQSLQEIESTSKESRDLTTTKTRRPRPARSEHLTNEERAERERQSKKLRDVLAEFGQFSVGSHAPSTDAISGNGLESERQQVDYAGKIDNVPYLFQFPPILPDLDIPAVKKDPDADDLAFETPSLPKQSTHRNTAKGSVKTEQDRLNDLPSSIERARKPRLNPGHVGKLRLHASGKMSLSWGGTSLSAETGTTPSFLQTVTLMSVHPSEDKTEGDQETSADEEHRDREARGFKGNVTSFGQVRGKLVVTPDWNEILG